VALNHQTNKQKFYTVRTVPKSDKKIEDTEEKLIPLAVLQASTLTYFSTCPFGQLTKKSTCPTQSFSCPKKLIKITKTRE
jgi:hypothetical protein